MFICLKIYLVCFIIITICEMYNTHSVVVKPTNPQCGKTAMDPITFVIGNMFLGVIWPVIIVVHICEYFRILSNTNTKR